MGNQNHHRLSLAGLLITLGIVYGDIGTSPLYVMKAIVGETFPITQETIFGAFSCIFWTMTLQTTLKYVFITLRADNKGEGGIFSLYALVRRSNKYLIFAAILGGSTLLADGIITPAISITSAVEGLRVFYPDITTTTIVEIVIVIISGLFFIQQFGTAVIGRLFGPFMLLWFSMLLVLGGLQLIGSPEVLEAVNPLYAYRLLTEHPKGFFLLGAVFLCVTGAEALYSDLGHCGRKNIQISWLFVKTSLVINYAGQSAWMLSLVGQPLGKLNPMFEIMPDWWQPFGVLIATISAVIASQALISGSFTLVNEAILLNLWPRLRIVYPSVVKGQLYIPAINTLLWVGCIAVVLYFQESHHMEAAYGLAITLTMLMTSILLFAFLRVSKVSLGIAIPLVVFFIGLEFCFLVANSVKFFEGGWISLLMSSFLAFVMLVWMWASRIKRRYTEFVKMADHLQVLCELSQDESVPKYATNLIYLTGSEDPKSIDWKIIYSILRKQPKRADVYWFVHVKTMDEPYTMEYRVEHVADNDVIWIEFRLGFRIQPRINTFFRKVVEELVNNKEVDIQSRYASLSKFQVTGDFRFIVLERYLSYGVDFPAFEKLMMNAYFFLKRYSLSDSRGYGLDASSVTVEMVPLAIPENKPIQLKRIH